MRLSRFFLGAAIFLSLIPQAFAAKSTALVRFKSTVLGKFINIHPGQEGRSLTDSNALLQDFIAFVPFLTVTQGSAPNKKWHISLIPSSSDEGPQSKGTDFNKVLTDVLRDFEKDEYSDVPAHNIKPAVLERMNEVRNYKGHMYLSLYKGDQNQIFFRLAYNSKSHQRFVIAGSALTPSGAIEVAIRKFQDQYKAIDLYEWLSSENSDKAKLMAPAAAALQAQGVRLEHGFNALPKYVSQKSIKNVITVEETPTLRSAFDQWKTGPLPKNEYNVPKAPSAK